MAHAGWGQRAVPGGIGLENMGSAKAWLINAHQRETVVELVNSGTRSAADVARLFRVHRSTISRELARHRATHVSVEV